VPVTVQCIAQLTNIPALEIEKVLAYIIQQQPHLGKYHKLEQVFIRNKESQKMLDELRSPLQLKHYTCYNCGLPIEQNTKSCPDCNKAILVCSVCKLPISFGETVGSCSLCETKGHLIHMQEWVKTQGKCPVCLQALPIEGIVPEEIHKAKKK